MGGAVSVSTPPPELVVLQLGVGWEVNCMIRQLVIFSSGTRVGSVRPFRRLDLDCRFISEASEAHERKRVLQRHGSLLLKWQHDSPEARAMERRHFGKARANRACFVFDGNFITLNLHEDMGAVAHYVALRFF